METVSLQLISEALTEADLAESAVYTNYSGRGMYGKECLGIVGSLGELLQFVLAMESLGQDTTWVQNVRQDSMGLDSIFYWPSIEVEDDLVR